MIPLVSLIIRVTYSSSFNYNPVNVLRYISKFTRGSLKSLINVLEQWQSAEKCIMHSLASQRNRFVTLQTLNRWPRIFFALGLRRHHLTCRNSSIRKNISKNIITTGKKRITLWVTVIGCIRASTETIRLSLVLYNEYRNDDKNITELITLNL